MTNFIIIIISRKTYIREACLDNFFFRILFHSLVATWRVRQVATREWNSLSMKSTEWSFLVCGFCLRRIGVTKTTLQQYG